MAAFLSFIPPRLLYGAVALVCAFAALTGTYLLGKHDGRSQAAVDALKATVEAYETRKEIDDEVDRSDLVDICIELGGIGMRQQCSEQLRRMDEAAGGE